MKTNYYALIAGLPDWKPDDKKSPLSLIDLHNELRETLTADDLHIAELFYMPFDHANILSKLYNTQALFDARGKYTEQEIEHIVDIKAIESDDVVAEEYLISAVSNFYATEPRLSLTAMSLLLQEGWLNLLLSSNNAFVVNYAKFSNTLQSILIALQSRKYNTNLSSAIVGTDDVTESIRKSKAHDFGLKGEVDIIEQLLQIFEIQNLVEREMKIDALKWAYIDDATFFNYFSIEKVIAAIIKLTMLERWTVLDEQNGRQKFVGIISTIKESYEKSKK